MRPKANGDGNAIRTSSEFHLAMLVLHWSLFGCAADPKGHLIVSARQHLQELCWQLPTTNRQQWKHTDNRDWWKWANVELLFTVVWMMNDYGNYTVVPMCQNNSSLNSISFFLAEEWDLVESQWVYIYIPYIRHTFSVYYYIIKCTSQP